MVEETNTRSAPYANFNSLINFFDKMNDTVVPSRIDRSIFGGASGSQVYSTISSLKSLQLIDDDGVPNEIFQKVVNADEDGRKEHFLSILRNTYPTLWDGDIDLKAMTAGQFDEHLKNYYGLSGSTIDKAAAFFISAATFANLEISEHVKNRKPTQSSSSSRRSSKSKRKTTNEEETTKTPEPQISPASSKPLEHQLIDLMSEDDIEDEVKSAIWSLVQYLTSRKKRLRDPE